jgi:hypothetical protein
LATASTDVGVPASAAGVTANATGRGYKGDGGLTAVTAYDNGITNGVNHAVCKGLSGDREWRISALRHRSAQQQDRRLRYKPAELQGKFAQR